MKHKNLLALTVAFSPKWLKEALDTFRDPLDVVVIDDGSPPKYNLAGFCKKRGIVFLGKSRAKGLTNSWNNLYWYFRDHNYMSCIISNDDVKFPRGFSDGLLAGLKRFDLMGPLSNNPGDGRYQGLGKFGVNMLGSPTNFDQVQNAIQVHRKHFLLEVRYLNGFCFAFSHRIKGFMYSNRYLFNPKKTNVGNEGDLIRRIRRKGGRVAVSRISYVFHWKARTYRELGRHALKNRDSVWTRWGKR